MQFNRLSERFGKSGIFAEPGTYDGVPPFSSLWMDIEPDDSDADRFAVACVLTFGPYVAGEALFPQEISARCTEAIRNYLMPFAGSVGPTVWKQRPFARGSGRLVIGQKIEAVLSGIGGEPNERGLVVLPSYESAGRMSLDGLIVSGSNACLFDSVSRARYEVATNALLSVGVLLAADSMSDCLVLPSPSNVSRVEDVDSLLRSVGLRLDYV